MDISVNNYKTKMPRREQLIACWRTQEAFPAEGLLSWVIKEEREFSRWDFDCGREGGFLPGCVFCHSGLKTLLMDFF